MCDKFICPLMQKTFLNSECQNIMSRLDSVLLDKQKGTYSPLDNFNTLAVCRRVGFCRQIDSPFDGDLFNAIVDQAKVLTANENKGAAAAVAAATAGQSKVTIPSMKVRVENGGQAVWLPGLQADISIWWPNDGNLDRAYGFFSNIQSGGPVDAAGVQEEKGWYFYSVNGHSVGSLGGYGTIAALMEPMPGQTATLHFEVDGILWSTPKDVVLTYTSWPADYHSFTKTGTPTPGAAATPATHATPATPAAAATSAAKAPAPGRKA